MQPIKPKWMNSGLVLVCERCYKERIPEEDPGKAAEIGDFNLRDWLKKRLKADGRWGKIRAISTSCMDVCARQRVTAVIDPQIDGEPAEAFVLDPVADREEFYAKIVERLGGGHDGATTMDAPQAGFERYEDESIGPGRP